MPQSVPLQPIPNQTVQCQLGGQACTLNVYQESTGLFMDVITAAGAVVTGRICLNATLIVRYAYLGFIGDLEFLDTQNLSDPSDPDYTGLGDRFVLIYLSAEEVAALNLSAGVS